MPRNLCVCVDKADTLGWIDHLSRLPDPLSSHPVIFCYFSDLHFEMDIKVDSVTAFRLVARVAFFKCHKVARGLWIEGICPQRAPSHYTDLSFQGPSNSFPEDFSQVHRRKQADCFPFNLKCCFICFIVVQPTSWVRLLSLKPMEGVDVVG